MGASGAMSGEERAAAYESAAARSLAVGPTGSAMGACGTSKACQSTGAGGGAEVFSLEQPAAPPRMKAAAMRARERNAEGLRMGVSGGGSARAERKVRASGYPA